MAQKFFQKSQAVADADGFMFRFMTKSDKAAAMDIEAKSFETPMPEADYMAKLRHLNCMGCVAEVDGRVVGSVVYETHSKIIKVMRFAVLPEFRRCRIGSKMIDRMVQKLAIEHMDSIALEITETNLSGQLFFAAKGFRATAIVNDRWEDGQGAAYVMCFSHEHDPVGKLEAGNRLTQYFR